MLNNWRTLAPLGAILLPLASAITLPSTVTTTIPYIGTCTTTTTLNPCHGHVTVVIQTPIHVPACTTTTVSTTTSSTATPTPSAGGACLLINPFCRPEGLDIHYYPNPFYGYSHNLSSSYYITQGLSPKDSSLTNRTFFPQTTPADEGGRPRIFPDPAHPNGYYVVGLTRGTNGGVVVDANNFTVVYQGFYRAPETGTYNICSSADNRNEVFFGDDNAFDCLSGKTPAASKPIIISTGGSYQNRVVCRKVDLQAGFYYPIRSVMGNAQGPSAFNLTIQEPDVAFGQRTNNWAGHVYPHKCGFFL
ncbi:hypothetical protein VTH82DRAFT_1555 [Thermothelomyces myriococcoides]